MSEWASKRAGCWGGTGEGEEGRKFPGWAEQGAREPVPSTPSPERAGASEAYKARARAGDEHCPTVAMDQHTLDVEDTVDAGHPAGAARLTETVCPSDAATLKDTVRPTAAAAPTAAALPRDAVYPVVNVRDPEAVWPSAPLSCSRRRLLLGCPGALVLSALVIGALCGPIALFTPTQTLPALTVTTSPCPGRKTAVSNTGCSHTTPQVRPVWSLGPFLTVWKRLCPGRTPLPRLS